VHRGRDTRRHAVPALDDHGDADEGEQVAGVCDQAAVLMTPVALRPSVEKSQNACSSMPTISKMENAKERFGPRQQARRERLRDLFCGGS
jgi:hypothetical protein